jgi:hypothetical protein
MTPNELGRKIESLAFAISTKKTGFLVQGGLLLEGLMKQRIFNDGKATSGSKIGKYKSKKWIKTRTESGFQTGYVDLQFTGDLIGSIQVVEDGGDVYLAIINDKDFDKAKVNEARRKKVIFEPSKAERIETEKYISELIEIELEQLFNLL